VLAGGAVWQSGFIGPDEAAYLQVLGVLPIHRLTGAANDMPGHDMGRMQHRPAAAARLMDAG
jgi:hypothetical protein